MATPSSVIDALSGRRPSERGFVRVNCPLCEDVTGTRDRTEALAYNVRTGWWKCWRCLSQGPLSRAAREEWSALVPKEEKDEEEVVITLPEGTTGYVPLWREPGASSLYCARARRYLDGRRISPRVREEAEIGVVLNAWYGAGKHRRLIRHRICVPVRERTGKLVGWVARTYIGDTPKVLYPRGMRRILYNERALYEDTDRPLYVVEGVFDAFALWPNVVACLGKPTNDHVLALAASRRPKVVVLDGDAWHDAEALYLKLCILGAEATWIKLPAGEDPAELGRKWFRQRRRQGMGTIKSTVSGRTYEMELFGRKVLASWGTSPPPKGLMIYDLEQDEADAVLEAINGTKLANATDAGKPKRTTNGKARAEQLELPDGDEEVEAAPAKSSKKAAGKAPVEDDDEAPKAKAKKASKAPVEDEEDEEDEEEDEEDESGIPAALAKAVSNKAVAQWAISVKGAKTADAIWAAVKSFVGDFEFNKGKSTAKLEATIRRRAEAIFNPGGEAEA